MTFIPVDVPNTKLMLQNDAQQLRTMQQWVAQRYTAYNLNLGTTQMTALGISSDDQTHILAFMADLARLNDFMTGTLPGVASDMRYDIAGVLGVM